MIRRPPRSTLSSSSAASDVYKRQVQGVQPAPRVLARKAPKPVQTLPDPEHLRARTAPEQVHPVQAVQPHHRSADPTCGGFAAGCRELEARHVQGGAGVP
eukprot:TRINITY_DN11722_c0_g1_i15.p1 TRINITY_DN11722_c0_g1~~TRINITY_DN11722_c0_g1_i15.p1  ORF type:complete len:100 (-),score=16.54 TRINITY_DN11722_c0_g1_i15:553-852(-)